MSGPPLRRGSGSAQSDLFSRPAAPSNAAARVLSVSELTGQLKGTIETRFAQVAVRGEVSNFKPAGSGHLYFTLKDDGACIGAVLFRAGAQRLRFALKDGMQVVARGRISVYEPRGQYQLICDAVEPEGAGALAIAFEQLKAKLAKEGLFDPARKRRIPFLPRRIGVVTSPSGAAIRDFLRVLHDRFPLPVLIVPARVQGEGAAEEVARGVTRLAASGLVDVIVVTRGGGSIEDLWAFNEEVLARAIAASPVPVISAVGHEVDFTIADFVADKRCATPTDAAKTLAPVKRELAENLDKHRRHLREILLRLLGLRRERLQHRLRRLGDPRRRVANERLRLDDRADRLQQALQKRVAQGRLALRESNERLARAHPSNRLRQLNRALHGLDQGLAQTVRQRLARERQRLELLGRRLMQASPQPALHRQHRSLALLRERAEKAMRRRGQLERARFIRASTALDSLSPLKVLGRGYSIAFAGGHVLRRSEDAPVGTGIEIMLPDRSRLDAQVTNARPADAAPAPAAEPGAGEGTGRPEST